MVLHCSWLAGTTACLPYSLHGLCGEQVCLMRQSVQTLLVYVETMRLIQVAPVQSQADSLKGQMLEKRISVLPPTSLRCKVSKAMMFHLSWYHLLFDLTSVHCCMG